jgi:hypothetical protein
MRAPVVHVHILHNGVRDSERSAGMVDAFPLCRVLLVIDFTFGAMSYPRVRMAFLPILIRRWWSWGVDCRDRGTGIRVD